MQLYILHFQRETFAQAIDLVGYNNRSCCEYRYLELYQHIPFNLIISY